MSLDEAAGYRSGFVAVVGRPNVGKSTLVNRLVGFKVAITSKKPQTTRHRIHGVLTNEQMQAVFVDTPGFQDRNLRALNRQLNRTVVQTLADVDVILFVVESLKFSEGDERVLALLPKRVPVIAVLSKVDLVQPKERLLPFMQSLAAKHDFAAIVPLSAEKGQQLDALLAEVRARLPEGPAMFPEDQPTDRSVKFLAGELIREKLFRLTGDELPYACTIVIEKFEERPKMTRVFATIVVERDSHKAIVIGDGGSRISRIGAEARADLEKLLDTTVYLELFVKIRSGWADNEAAVRAYGYE